MKYNYKTFYPFGDAQHEIENRIIYMLSEGWEVALVYGGDTPTVILRKLI